MNSCRRLAFKALKINESTCTHMKCTFGGIWNGGGGDGQKNLFVASFFFDRAAEVSLIQVSMLLQKKKAMNDFYFLWMYTLLNRCLSYIGWFC